MALKKLLTTFSQNQSFFKSQGVGLGLSTAKILALSLCGGISIRSKPGRGTNACFSVFVTDESNGIKPSALRANVEVLERKMTDSLQVDQKLQSRVARHQFSSLNSDNLYRHDEGGYSEAFCGDCMCEQVQELHQEA